MAMAGGIRAAMGGLAPGPNTSAIWATVRAKTAAQAGTGKALAAKATAANKVTAMYCLAEAPGAKVAAATTTTHHGGYRGRLMAANWLTCSD
jgi:hypothetical protein